MTITGGELRFFETLAALLGSRLRTVRRLGPQVVYFRLEDGRELVHKEVPRQERSSWRPGRPWTELVWIDFLGSEGLPVPKLAAADTEHGWLVEHFVAGRLLSEEAGGALERLLASLTGIEAAAAAAPDDVRAFVAYGAEADIETERGYIARWLKDDARRHLDQLIAEGFEGAQPAIGPLDVRAENAIDTGDEVVLLDFATVGADYTERRLAGYLWTARPSPRSFLTRESFRAVEHRLGRKAALRLAFFDFAHCARALARCARGRAQPTNGALPESGAVDALREEWRRRRLDDERVEAIGRGLRL